MDSYGMHSDTYIFPLHLDLFIGNWHLPQLIDRSITMAFNLNNKSLTTNIAMYLFVNDYLVVKFLLYYFIKKYKLYGFLCRSLDLCIRFIQCACVYNVPVGLFDQIINA